MDLLINRLDSQRILPDDDTNYVRQKTKDLQQSTSITYNSTMVTQPQLSTCPLLSYFALLTLDYIKFCFIATPPRFYEVGLRFYALSDN